MGLKWRQLIEPKDSVFWVDKMPAEDFAGMSVSPTIAPVHIGLPYPTLPSLPTYLPRALPLIAATARRGAALRHYPQVPRHTWHRVYHSRAASGSALLGLLVWLGSMV